jgi:hypothetical protein
LSDIKNNPDPGKILETQKNNIIILIEEWVETGKNQDPVKEEKKYLNPVKKLFPFSFKKLKEGIIT